MGWFLSRAAKNRVNSLSKPGNLLDARYYIAPVR